MAIPTKTPEVEIHDVQIRDVVIREAGLADHAFIRAQAPRLAGIANLPGRPAAAIQAFQDALIEAALTSPPAGSRTLIACMSPETPLGFIHLEPAADPLLNTPAGYVSMVAVATGAEGCGIGHLLMQAAEAWGREQGFTCLSLDAFASNRHARAFYESQGFHEDSVKLYKLLD
ncbi:MAG TPA: GNAT family N-acetyltransferase [Terriglobia bacterium]|nr:GNAT family N-acetyltransferase [Terriglobia bacterium]